jgi:DNA primase
MIPKETINQIMDAARIEEVVGDYVTMKKRGSNFLGLCPFHNEKTPSFNVSPSKGIYKCFGCGKAGNVVGFVMEHEHLTYREAIKLLGKRYNIEVEEAPRSNEEIEQDNKRESLYIVNTYAQNYFHDFMLQEEEGKNIGLSYFRERGLGKEVTDTFKLGFCPSDGKTFTETAIRTGYNEQILKELGLTTEKGNDFFRGRVIFTIHSVSGKVLGFGARTLSADKKVPKYLNSPESEIYNKSKVLYGMFQARQDISKMDECYLVEGYMDVISLHQAGIRHVVASSGTSLTHDQVRLIKRYTNNLTILYDGDPAGIKAALRGLDVSLEEGLNVKVMLLPEGQDPDTWVQELGAEALMEQVAKEKKDLIHLRTSLFLEDAKNDPVNVAEIVKEIAFSISLIPEPITRSLYIKQASNSLGVEEVVLIQEANRLIRKRTLDTLNKQDRASAEAVAEAPVLISNQQRSVVFHLDEIQERDIVRLLLENSNYELQGENAIKTILENLQDIEIDHPVYKKVIDEYKNYYNEQEFLPQSHFINHNDPKISKLCTDLLQSPYEISENWSRMHEVFISDKSVLVKRDIGKAISILKLKKVVRMKNDLEKKIREMQGNENNEEELMENLRDAQQLDSFIRQLSEVTGTAILPYHRN